MKKIKLLLIEDNRLLRDGITAILKPYGDITIIGGAGDNTQSLAKIQQLKPDVVLLGLGLKNQTSLSVVESVKAHFPAAKIIIMDMAPVQSEILQYVKTGANGFIMKDASVNDFLVTIRKVAEGTTVLPPLLVDSLFSQIVDNAVRDDKPKKADSVRMTSREREVISLLSEGLSNKEIGVAIQVSMFTVKSHIHNIMEKLGMHSRLEIANHNHSG